MKYYYHATPSENTSSILKEGIKASNFEKAVFVTDSSDAAARFLSVRLVPNITVFKIKVTHQQELKYMEESFDHSSSFFKCRAWMYHNDIPVDMIKDVKEYKLS